MGTFAAAYGVYQVDWVVVGGWFSIESEVKKSWFFLQMSQKSKLVPIWLKICQVSVLFQVLVFGYVKTTFELQNQMKAYMYHY